jgi:hypothetical protein
MPTSLKHFIAFTLFTALNLLLVTRHRNAVPKRDILVVGIGLAGLLVAAQFKQVGVGLEGTRRWRVLYLVLHSLELTFKVLLPWWLVFHDSHNGYLMAPHLFVFQAQIALEGLLFMAGPDYQLCFWYTVIANTYRASALMTWVTRTLGDDVYSVKDRPLLATLLPGIAVCLWIFENLYFWFEWYPLLRSDETMAATTLKKNE